MNQTPPTRRSQHDAVIALLLDTFRPLGFFAGEYLAALAPLLPVRALRWLFPNPALAEFEALERLLDDLTAREEKHV